MTTESTNTNSSQSEPDLDAIQNRVNETRRAFLDALRKCSDDDEVGKKIADDYLKRFLDDDPKRADLARDHAREAIQLLESFGSSRASITSNVALVNLKMHTAIAGLQVDAIGKLLDFGNPKEEIKETDPTLAALAQIRGFMNQTKRAIEEAKNETFQKAVQIGEDVVQVQALATIALLVRQATLHEFRRKELDVGWSDIGRRVAEQLKEESREELIQHSWDLLLEIAAELATIVIEEVSPLHKIPGYLKRLAKIVGVGKASIAPGGTDSMMKLLSQLRKEAQLLANIDTAYTLAMDRMDQLRNPPPPVVAA